MKRALIVAVCCCAWASVTASAFAQAPPELTSRDIIRVLQTPIDMKDFQSGGMVFKDVLSLIYDTVAEQGLLGKKGIGLPILIDQQGFKDAAPEAPDLYEGQVRFPPYPKRMTLATALQYAIVQAIPVEATFVIRRGTVEITAAKSATLDKLLQQKILANYEQKRLDEVLHELAEQTGVSILLDSRAKDKHAMPVTAFFRNDISVRDVLTILANMADLQIVELTSAIYVTTPANAEVLRKAQPRQKPSQPLPDSSPK
jgi:hypothetical protein